ncbi:hypothetical protein HN873_041932 [Arachis hypogaea]
MFMRYEENAGFRSSKALFLSKTAIGEHQYTQTTREYGWDIQDGKRSLMAYDSATIKLRSGDDHNGSARPAAEQKGGCTGLLQSDLRLLRNVKRDKEMLRRRWREVGRRRNERRRSASGVRTGEQ